MNIIQSQTVIGPSQPQAWQPGNTAQIDRQIDRQTDRQIDRQTDRQTDRQIDRYRQIQTDRDRQTYKHRITKPSTSFQFKSFCDQLIKLQSF